MSETSAKAGAPETPKRARARSTLSADVKPRTVLIILVVAGLAFLAYTRGGSLLDAYQRSSIARQENAPTELHGLRFGMSRMDVAKMFADSGVKWENITKPGIQPTAWAAQQHLSINGFSTVQMSVRFADGVCWDYGAGELTTDSEKVVDPKALVGPLDPDSALNGIMWNFESKRPLGAVEIATRQVPLNVLQLLGSWHSEDKEITGIGNVYKWNWSEVSAVYRTVDGSLQFQSQGSPAAVTAAAGAAGPAVPIGPASEVVESGETEETADPDQ